MATRKDLAKLIHKNSNRTLADSEQAIKDVLSSLAELFSNNTEDSIVFPGFGAFKKLTRKARKGINPLTKKPMNVPEKTTYTFKLSKKIKDIINK